VLLYIEEPEPFVPGAVKENRGQLLLEKAEGLQLENWGEHRLAAEDSKK